MQSCHDERLAEAGPHEKKAGWSTLHELLVTCCHVVTTYSLHDVQSKILIEWLRPGCYGDVLGFENSGWEQDHHTPVILP